MILSPVPKKPVYNPANLLHAMQLHFYRHTQSQVSDTYFPQTDEMEEAAPWMHLLALVTMQSKWHPPKNR